jgi:hypothetical protein
MFRSIAAAVVALTITVAPGAAATDWKAVAANRIVGEAVRNVATTGKLSPAAVADEAKRLAAAEHVKLGKVDYDGRIARYLIAEQAKQIECSGEPLVGSVYDSINALTAGPQQQLAAQGVTLNVDWKKLGLDELERYRESAGRRPVWRKTPVCR